MGILASIQNQLLCREIIQNVDFKYKKFVRNVLLDTLDITKKHITFIKHICNIKNVHIYACLLNSSILDIPFKNSTEVCLISNKTCWKRYYIDTQLVNSGEKLKSPIYDNITFKLCNNLTLNLSSILDTTFEFINQ